MADSDYNVYIDSSFVELSSDEESASVEFTSKLNDLIGIVDFKLTTVFSRAIESNLNSTVVLNLKDLEYDTFSIPTQYNVSNYTYSRLDTEINSVFNPLTSGSINIPISYVGSGLVPLSGSINSDIDLILGERFTTTDSIIVDFDLYNSILSYKNNFIEYTNYTGILTGSGTPLPSYDTTINRWVEYTLPNGHDNLLNNIVELFFAGWVLHPIKGDLIVASQKIDTVVGDIELEEYGKKTGFNIDATCATVSGVSVLYEVTCGLVDYYEVLTDISLISGTKNNLSSDVLVTEEYTNYLQTDIALFPIYFDNFTLNETPYIAHTSSICVDAHDSIYGLVASGTYFRIGTTVLSGTLTPIDDGYKICFQPEDYINLFDGITTITAHAENYNGDMLEENYYLTSGYIVDFDNKERIGLDYGFNNIISVRMEAEDLAECPTTITDGYWFVSEQLPNSDLKASITGQTGSYREISNLSSSIYPQSTAYFYGKEFEVEITAEDFAGNTIEPYIINFRIQSKND